MSLRPAFPNLMEEIAEHDDRLIVLVSDISHGIFQNFSRRFPGRFKNLGICEPSIVGLAAGLSHVGFIPVVHTIAPFLVERSLEQIKLDFGYQRKDVCLVSVGSSFDYSQLGCSHHSYYDAAAVAQVPGSQVYIPGSVREFQALFRATYDSPGIKYYRLTENPHTAGNLSDIKAGRAIRVLQGSDVTVVALGPRLEDAVSVAQDLLAEGVSTDLLYVHSLKPFDSAAVKESVASTGRLVSVEELGSRDGLFARCLEAVRDVDAVRVSQVAVSDFVRGYGSYQDLCVEARVDRSAIRAAVDSVLVGRG